MKGKFKGGRRFNATKTAMQKGRDAFNSGKTENDCPYGITRQAMIIDWHFGYQEAKKFQEAQK